MTQDLREALEQQIAEWREIGNGGGKHERSSLEQFGFEQCADDLEDLLQEHQE